MARMKRTGRRALARPAKKVARADNYETLHDLLILKLQSLHDVERQQIDALPKMVKAATDEKLREAFAEHLGATKGHVERLDAALDMLGVGKHNSRVEAIRGLVEDADWLIKSVQDAQARDAALIAAAQYIEHYEIAGYGAARAWAEEMGNYELSEILQQTLDEEGDANDTLTGLALGGVNDRANVTAA